MHSTDVRIGCKRDARKALGLDLKLLGNGGFRTAYIDHREAVVYKVGDQRANRIEIDVARYLREQGERCISPTTGWIIAGQIVVAQPAYQVANEANQATMEFRAAEDHIYGVANKWGMADIYARNWGFDDSGDAFIFDLNCEPHILPAEWQRNV